MYEMKSYFPDLDTWKNANNSAFLREINETDNYRVTAVLIQDRQDKQSCQNPVLVSTLTVQFTLWHKHIIRCKMYDRRNWCQWIQHHHEQNCISSGSYYRWVCILLVLILWSSPLYAHKKGSGNIMYNELSQRNVVIADLRFSHHVFWFEFES